MTARSASFTACEVNWLPGPKGWEMKEIPGTEFVLPADLVLIAMGFLHVVRTGIVEELGVKLDGRGQRGGRQLDDEPARRLCRRRHGPRGLAGGPRHQSGPHHGRGGGQVAAGALSLER